MTVVEATRLVMDYAEVWQTSSGKYHARVDPAEAGFPELQRVGDVTATSMKDMDALDKLHDKVYQALRDMYADREVHVQPAFIPPQPRGTE